MVIIIEGLDGTGKTTISKELSKRYNFEYVKESYTDDCKEKEYRMVLLLHRLLDSKIYIYDRATLIDDFVYSFLNQTTSTLTEYKNVIKALLKKCILIHLQLDEKTRSERFNERGDQYITNDQINQIANNYKEFYSDLDDVNYIDLTSDIDKDIENIMEVIKND